MIRATATIAVLAGLAPVPPLHAQVSVSEPYLAAVAKAGVSLRSGDLDSFYPILDLQPGTVLLVDGRSDGWLRVSYPPGASVFLLQQHGRPSADGASVAPAPGATLKAPNARFGLKGSWRDVVLAGSATLPPSLPILGVETTPDGSRSAFRVPAPPAARAFVRASDLREPTPSELRAYLDAGGIDPRAPAQPAPPPQAQPQEQAPPQAGPDAHEPTASPSVDQAPQPDLEAPTPEPDDVALLLRAFEQVQAQPIGSAEIEPLIAEFQAALDRIDPDRALARTALQQRLAVLRLLKRVQEQERLLAQARQEAEEGARSVADQVAKAQAGRNYTIVGRLTTSAVYDGTSRPLLFRIEAVGNGPARTLGYLRPDERFGLEKLLGRIVGVEGEASIDQSAGPLHIIRPQRVDVLAPDQGP